jgi:hypothetical protein
MLMIHNHYSPNFFAKIIMESSILNIFVNMEAKPNGLYVGVACLARCMVDMSLAFW